MRKIKNIIVPTDFSAISHCAFEYAQKLAEVLNSEITLIHVKEYMLPASEMGVLPYLDTNESNLHDAMNSFIDKADNMTTLRKAKIKTKFLKGKITDVLVDYSSKSEVDLIVMGTTGLQDFLSKVIGSVSLEVSNKAHCPVFLVPRDAKWQPIHKLMFTSNYLSITPKTVRSIINFAEILQSNIHFVHVKEGITDDNRLMETVWNELFATSQSTVGFEMHTIYGNNTVESLSEYAVNNAIDIIAFVNKKRNFWKKLMHLSITENIAISTNIPMLIVHYDDALSS